VCDAEEHTGGVNRYDPVPGFGAVEILFGAAGNAGIVNQSTSAITTLAFTPECAPCRPMPVAAPEMTAPLSANLIAVSSRVTPGRPHHVQRPAHREVLTFMV
jgi:hypothetical protein